MKDSGGWAMSVLRVPVEPWIFDWMTRPRIVDLLERTKWGWVCAQIMKTWNDLLDIPPRGGGTLYNSLHARLSFSIPARQPLFFRQRSKSCWKSYTPWSLSTEAGMCRSLFSLMYMSVSGNWEKVSGTVSMRLLLMYSISSCGINLKTIYFIKRQPKRFFTFF